MVMHLRQRFLLCCLVLILLAGTPGCSQRVAGTPTPASTAQTATVSTPTLTPEPGVVEKFAVWMDESIRQGALHPDQALVLHFNRPVNPASTQWAVITDPFLVGETTWSDGNRTLSFRPEEGFRPGTTYQMYLDPALTGADGSLLDPFPHWTLFALRAPGLTGISPAGGLLKKELSVVKLTFNHRMNRESVEGGFKIQPEVPYRLSWKSNTLEITLPEPLQPGSHYQFVLSGDVTNAHGMALGEDIRWDYWIEGFKATTSSVFGKTFDIDFNYPVDTLASGPQFTIQPDLPGHWKWIGDQRIRFVADTYLAVIPQYTVTINGPLPKPGGGKYPVLEPLVVVPLSAINSYGPGGDFDKSNDNPPKIWIQFTHPVDHESVEAAFSISPEVAGKFSWNDYRMSFLPSEALPDKTEVAVTLDATALDAAGLPLLVEPFTWTFKIREDYRLQEPGVVNFGVYGPNAQVLNINGRQAIQFSNNSPDQSPAIFTLHRIEAGDFTALYREYFHIQTYFDEIGLIDTHGLEKVASWPVAFSDTIQETLLPEGLAAGVYLLDIGIDGQKCDQLFLVLTRHKLVVKRSNEGVWVWATDFKGNNIANLHVRLFSKDGSILREGKTNADGIFTTPLYKGDAPLLVTALSADGDLTTAGLSDAWEENSYWYWHDPYLNSTMHDFRGYLYTERPIYRPGQTVYYKAVVRGDDDIHYSVPQKGTPVAVRLLDGRGNEIQRQEIPLNDYGTLNGSFTLGEGAMLGAYSIEGNIEGETFNGTFLLQEYHKPDFQVEADLAANAYVMRDRIKVEVDVRYFFDRPVANAKITGGVYNLAPKIYDYWLREINCSDEPLRPGDYYWESKSFNLQEQFTDANGRATLIIPTPVDDFYGCRSDWQTTLQECYVGIEISAADSSGQTVTISKAIRVYNAPVRVAVDTGDWKKRIGENFDATITATDRYGQPVAGQKVKLTVNCYSSSCEQDKEIQNRGQTGADGKLIVPLKIEKPGYFEITLETLSANGSVTSEISDWVYVVSGRGGENLDYGDLKINVERKQYKPYEKARLLITTPFDGPALITFERGQIIHTRPIMLTAPLTEVEVEIIPEDAPNIFVVINAWKSEYQTLAQTLAKMNEDFFLLQSLSDARLYRAEVELQVDAGMHRLNVSIEPDRAEYRPRQEANLTVRVTNAQNQPVQAELSLALVDEAIFSLSDDRSGLIFDAFYGRRAHLVDTYNSMALSRYLQDQGECGGGGGDYYFEETSPRSNFQDTAIWLPEIRTDANGVATVSVTLPDNLTRWRVVVKAITAATQAGEASATILTRKDLLVSPMLPQELVIGDRVALSATVHNYSTRDMDLNVSLVAGGLTLESDASLPVTVAAGETQKVTWWATATRSGEIPVTIRASAPDGLEDAVQLPLPVRPRSIPTVITQVGDFHNEFIGVLALPPNLLSESSIELKLSRSISGNLMDGLGFLTGYPYGCVEQTMSRALPNAVVGRALSQLGLDNPGLVERMPGLINQGLQQLYGYQHDDGGWGWWHDDDSDAYQTAWVVFGLSVTREAGYPVELQVIERGVYFLREQIESKKIDDPRTQVYVLYSLARAGYGAREQTLEMIKQVESLDSFSLAGLALAFHALGEKEQAGAILSRLDARVQLDGEKAFWSTGSTDGYYHSKAMSSNVRATALGLSAYLQIAPDHERIPQLVRYLMSQRKSYGWGSTNETAFTLLALTDYLLLEQRDEGDILYRVLVNDVQVASGTLHPGAPLQAIPLPIEQMRVGPNLIRIVQTGGGRLYYTLTSNIFQDLPMVDAAGVVKITRTYTDPITGQPITHIQAGQVVRVTLKITGDGRPFAYLMVEDHLPAGLEAINERLNTSVHDNGLIPYSDRYSDWVERESFRWKRYGYNNKEIRGGRVIFFITAMNRKEVKVITYLARATQSGTFIALPAEFSAMYDSSVWGRSSSAVFTVE